MPRTLIIGQGLAGSAVAWTLYRQGQHFLIVDSAAPSTSSRVAAGLITPITGQRLVQSADFEQQWKTAAKFYRAVESLTAARLLHQHGSVRIFKSDDEKRIYEQRRDRADYTGHVRTPDPLLSPLFHTPHGAFEMCSGGRLDVPLYLEVTKEFFTIQNAFHQGTIDPVRMNVSPQGVTVPELQETFSRVIFCQGYEPAHHWFPAVKFNPAKGEILTLRIPGLDEPRTVHGGYWLARCGEFYRGGATYDWANLDTTPTLAGREQILTGLCQFLKIPQSEIEVIDHQAAIRPTMHHFEPVMQLHPQYPRLAILTGLGSKGSLLAPPLAQKLVNKLARA